MSVPMLWTCLVVATSAAGAPLDSIPDFPSMLGNPPVWESGTVNASDSGFFELGAGVEPLWAAGATQWFSGGFSGSGGWGGTGLIKVDARSRNQRWAVQCDARHQRIPGVTGPWHALAYEWGVFDGWGRAYTPNLTSVAVTRFTGRVAHKLSPSMEVQAGMLEQHWGHGWRSVWWDRAAAPMPQVALHVDGERVRYAHVIGSKRDWSAGSPPDVPGTDASAWAPWQYAERQRSFLAAHMVSVDLGRGFQGTLFGAVTWLAQDSGVVNRVEPAYFVPFVAFRPTEYRLGSADNALIGMEGAWRSPDGRWLLSSQWLFDEWVTREMFGGEGWWANKWASVNSVRWRQGDLACTLERAQVRPYTFSHAAPGTSWTHDRSPIAHPNGANFIEWRVHGEGAWGPVRAHLGWTHLRQGVEDVEAALEAGRSIISAPPAADFSLGTSPLISYTQRPESYGIGAVYGGPGEMAEAGILTTQRVFADVDWAHERLGNARVFLRGAWRWARAESGESAGWRRLEVGLRLQPATEERDW